MTRQKPVLPTDWEEELVPPPGTPFGERPSKQLTTQVATVHFRVGGRRHRAFPVTRLRRTAEMLCQESPVVAPAAMVSPFRRVRSRTTGLLEKARPGDCIPATGYEATSRATSPGCLGFELGPREWPSGLQALGRRGVRDSHESRAASEQPSAIGPRPAQLGSPGCRVFPRGFSFTLRAASADLMQARTLRGKGPRWASVSRPSGLDISGV